MIRLIATFICLTLMSPVVVAAETMDDLVERGGLYYKKFTKTPFTGVLNEGRSQGKIRAGKKEGKWEFYHDNGQLKFTGNYENGKKEREWLSFDRGTGELWEKVNYKNGKKEGKRISYFKTGQVAVERNYQNDFLDGKKIEYLMGNPPGRIFNESNYKLGEKQGPSTSYWLVNGNLQSKAFHKSGKLNGPYIEYFSNGKDVMARGNYVEGKRDGYWEFFDAPGKKRFGPVKYEPSKDDGKPSFIDNDFYRITDESDKGSGVYKDGKKISP